MAKISSVAFVALTITVISVVAVLWRFPSDTSQLTRREGADASLPGPDREQSVVQAAKPASHVEREIPVAVAPESVAVGVLQGAYRKDIDRVNRVLRKAGHPEVAADKRVSLDDLGLLHEMVQELDQSIDECAERALDFADPFRESMLKRIREDVSSGRTPPFEVLRDGVIPDRTPHDILVTTVFNGVIYAGFVPKSNGLHEVLEAQRLAERARVESYLSWVAGLK